MSHLTLYMLKGSFLTADDGAAPAMKVTMNATVWRKLPEELIWEVLRFVPAVTHFRWQLVSRKWRQVLTSVDFRARLIAAAPRESKEEGEQQQQQPCVVAGVANFSWYSNPGKVKVVDIDLCSFVPSSFWKYRTSSYSVVAAADGLVCISNVNRNCDNSDEDVSSDKDDSSDESCDDSDSDDSDSESSADSEHEYNREPGAQKKRWRMEGSNRRQKTRKETQYCVLNPLTRTCKVLPPVPFKPQGWLPPTPTAVTMFGYMSDAYEAWHDDEVHVATCDLAAGGGGWDLAVCKPKRGFFNHPVVAVCAGTTYVYDGRRVRVLVPGGPGGRLVRAGSLKAPSRRPGMSEGHLVAHRGEVFFVRAQSTSKMRRMKVVMGVWRLARWRLEWELVARLKVAELRLLITTSDLKSGLKRIKRQLVHCCNVRVTSGVRELLCCSVQVQQLHVLVVGLNLDRGRWQLVQEVPDTFTAVELRPDLFLS